MVELSTQRKAELFDSIMANVPSVMLTHDTWTEVGYKRPDGVTEWTYDHRVPYGSLLWRCIYMAFCLVRCRDVAEAESKE